MTVTYYRHTDVCRSPVASGRREPPGSVCEPSAALQRQAAFEFMHYRHTDVCRSPVASGRRRYVQRDEIAAPSNV